MTRFPLSALFASATALLLFTMPQQADAYDHFTYRPAVPSCHGGYYPRVSYYHCPINRYDCGYDRNDSFIPERSQYQRRDRFAPAYPMKAPAPRRGFMFEQPNLQQPPLQVKPPRREIVPEKQFDPFEKYAPSQLNSQKPREGKSTPELPMMELPPPVPGSSNQPENSNQKATPQSQPHEHNRSGDQGKAGTAGLLLKPGPNLNNRSPSFQLELPRISPPSARFLIPQSR